jgi:mono/diheme cytochrome c family protein
MESPSMIPIALDLRIYVLSRWRWSVLFAMLFLAVHHAPAFAGSTSATDASAAKLYHNHCSVCHGDKGDGKSRASGALSTLPRDFTSEASKRDLSRERIVLAIKRGRPGTAMTSWQTQLSEENINALAEYILTQFVGRDHSAVNSVTIAPIFASWTQGGREAGAPSPSVTARGRTTGDTADIKLGRKVYNFRCYFCHGYSGDAKTLAATYLTPPPRDFTSGSQLTQRTILETVRHGRSGTAMKSFSGILSEAEMGAVSTFVVREFVRDKARNTAYHTTENGWPDHQRFSAAFPYVTGTIGLDRSVELLNPDQQRGRSLFLSVCMSCHDRPGASNEELAWASQPGSNSRAFGISTPDMHNKR